MQIFYKQVVATGTYLSGVGVVPSKMGKASQVTKKIGFEAGRKVTSTRILIITLTYCGFTIITISFVLP